MATGLFDSNDCIFALITYEKLKSLQKIINNKFGSIPNFFILIEDGLIVDDTLSINFLNMKDIGITDISYLTNNYSISSKTETIKAYTYAYLKKTCNYINPGCINFTNIPLSNIINSKFSIENETPEHEEYIRSYFESYSLKRKFIPSNTKKSILVIDWKIPRPDEDAGSVWMINVLKCINELNFETFFIPYDLNYNTSYYDVLSKNNIHIIRKEVLGNINEWLSLHSSKFDICLLSRFNIAGQFFQTIKTVAPQTKIIFSTSDLHSLRLERQARLNNQVNELEFAKQVKEIEFALIQHADTTIILSEEEEKKIRSEIVNPRLNYLSCVFETIDGSQNAFTNRKDILFIGGFRHKPNIDAILYFYTHIFPLVLEKIPDLRLKIVGSHMPEDLKQMLDHKNVDILGYVENVDPIFNNIKLSIAPLRYGAGIKGKIASSMIYGVPCIATSIAVESMHLSDSINVLVGDTPSEFSEKLCQAYQNQDFWTTLSVNAFNFALDNYSYSAMKNNLLSIFQSLNISE